MATQLGFAESEESKIQWILHNLKDETLLFFLMMESPPLIASILSFLPSDRAAKIMGGLKSDLAAKIVHFMATSGAQQPFSVSALLEEIASWIKKEKNIYKKSGVKLTSANLLEGLDRQAQLKILEQLHVLSPDLAQNLERQLIKFETLLRLPVRDLSKILSQIADTELGTLLSNSSPTAIEVLRNAVSKSRQERVCESSSGLSVHSAPHSATFSANLSAAEEKCLVVARRLGLLEDILEPRV